MPTIYDPEDPALIANRRTGISTRPLYPPERKQLTDFLDGPSPVPGGPFPVDPKKLSAFIYETGWHTDDFVHPERRHPHVAPDGRLVVTRAKKDVSAPDALISLVPHRRIVPWYREFLDGFPRVVCDRLSREPVEVRRRVRGRWIVDREKDGSAKVRAKCNCAVPYDLLVVRTCIAAGLPGAGMLTLRHTFGCRWYQATGDINVVMEKMGCSLAVALRYARLVGQKKWDELGADLADDPRLYTAEEKETKAAAALEEE